jgi:predicted AAA+ superfamily ATPase
MDNRLRYLKKAIETDALESKKIAFVSGPRQVGKTTMIRSMLSASEFENNYFNWDDDEFRKTWSSTPKRILLNKHPGSLIALDEIHKDRKWKNRLKGLYDLSKQDFKFIVTGSARLDFYRKSGDSLQGRYIPYRLHPFTLGESEQIKGPPQKKWDENYKPTFILEDLLKFGGFPEPLFAQDVQKAIRWRRLYRERLIREDLRDLQNVRDMQQVETLALLLVERAASQLSYESLRQDLSVSFESVKTWIELLEALFYCYRISPYSHKIKNSLKKEPKLFLYDWSLITDEGHRLENLVAGHLLKSCHAWTDCALGEFDLFYVRDKQKREVDFLVTQDRKPFALIEVKSGHSQPTDSLVYFQKVLQPKFCIQVVRDEKLEKPKLIQYPGIELMSVKRFLGSLE